jgi:flagellar biosynthesis/type III secretory pathway protein FliH
VCRAAASRERAAAESQREVQEAAARSLAIEDELRKSADAAHKRGWVDGYAEGYRAAQEAQRAASGAPDGAPAEASRQQRRAAERAAGKRRR